MTTATHLLWTPAEIKAAARHRGKINRGRPPPDWTGTGLALFAVFHLLVSLAIWAAAR